MAGKAAGGGQLSAKRGATVAAFAVVASAVVLQFGLSINLRLSTGDSLPGALIFFFSFFTILTNLMVAAVYLSALTAWGWLGWWRLPWVRGMVAGAILLVMTVYHFLLFGMADLNIWFVVADRMLHYVSPLLYVGWWLAFERHGALQWRELAKMLIYPAAYVVWAMARGAITGEYPYPFLAANELGYGQVALNGLGVLAVFIVLYAIVIATDRALGDRQLLM